MKCLRCGKENANDEIFCIYCGIKLKKIQANPVDRNPGAMREDRRVQNILAEYLPQLGEPAGNGGKFVAAPDIDDGNCEQIFDELLSVGILGQKNGMRRNGEAAIKSIRENRESIQGIFVSGYNKLNYLPTVLIFSDRALYAFWNNFGGWYMQDSLNGKGSAAGHAARSKRKFVFDCKCRYDAIERVSVLPTKVGEGVAGIGTSKVSCALLNSADLFEFAFEKKYIREDKLTEMISLLAGVSGGRIR